MNVVLQVREGKFRELNSENRLEREFINSNIHVVCTLQTEIQSDVFYKIRKDLVWLLGVSP